MARGEFPLASWVIPQYDAGMVRKEPLRKALLAEVEAFLKQHGMAHTTFGLRAVNDAKFVANLRAGLDPRSSTIDEVRLFMRERKPRDARKRASKSAAATASGF